MSSLLPDSLQQVVSNEKNEKKKRSLDTLTPLFDLLRNTGFFVLLLTQMVMCGKVNNLEHSNAPAFVQTVSGEGIPIEAKNPYFRSEETVRSFLNDWLLLAHNWGDEITGDDGKPQKDLGQKAGNGKTVPTGPFVATFAMEPGFAQAWADILIKDYQLPTYLNGKKTRTMVIRHLGTPKVESDGKKISVRVVADWYEKSKDDKNSIVTYSFRKIIVMTPVDVPVSPLKKNASAFDKAIYSVLAKGVRITSIEPIDF